MFIKYYVHNRTILVVHKKNCKHFPIQSHTSEGEGKHYKTACIKWNNLGLSLEGFCMW